MNYYGSSINYYKSISTRLTVLIFQSVGSCTIVLYGLQAYLYVLHEHDTHNYGPSSDNTMPPDEPDARN